jgi:hypothetical protein
LQPVVLSEAEEWLAGDDEEAVRLLASNASANYGVTPS